jgi:hypothetical protein
VDRGSEFSFTLPCKNGAGPPVREEETVTPSAASALDGDTQGSES